MPLRSYPAKSTHHVANLHPPVRPHGSTGHGVTFSQCPRALGRINWSESSSSAGMVKHVDFDSQVTAYLGNKAVRPDLVVNLSSQRHIVVDAKVPFSAYLDALKHPILKSTQLIYAAMRTWYAPTCNSFPIRTTSRLSPLPQSSSFVHSGGSVLGRCSRSEPRASEYAFERNVVNIATPTTLFALLRTVALGWRHEDISDKAREVQRLGSELYSRLTTVGDHYNRVGRSLEKAVEAFNSTLSSMDSRVMVTAPTIRNGYPYPHG